MTIANAEMAAAWDGPEGDNWTENAGRYEATDRWIAARFDAEVAIERTDRVLDVGCGTGRSTRTAARRAQEGSVLGVDLSSRMLDHARQRSAADGITNVEYVQGDAQVHPFAPMAFDLAISSFGAMFFADPVVAFANVRRALRPGGGIAFLAWQGFERNEWLAEIFRAVAVGRELPSPPAGRPGPFGLADADAVHAIVRDAGYVDDELTSLTEPVLLGHDPDDAWAFVSNLGMVRGLTEHLDADSRAAAMGELRATVDAHATDDGVVFGSAAWLITARRPSGERGPDARGRR